MVNRPKAQGTAWETKIVRAANEHPNLEAQRAPNNSPGRDVEIRLKDGNVVAVEAKDRANLNVHKLMAELRPRTVIAWARKSRKTGNTKRTADGPPVAVLELEHLLELLDELSRLRHHVPPQG